MRKKSWESSLTHKRERKRAKSSSIFLLSKAVCLLSQSVKTVSQSVFSQSFLRWHLLETFFVSAIVRVRTQEWLAQPSCFATCLFGHPTRKSDGNCSRHFVSTLQVMSEQKEIWSNSTHTYLSVVVGVIYVGTDRSGYCCFFFARMHVPSKGTDQIKYRPNRTKKWRTKKDRVEEELFFKHQQKVEGHKWSNCSGPHTFLSSA